jgi:serine kinase of HPr protein (carbohydrate metabolism regulator)
VITGGKQVPQETRELASKYNIAVLSSTLTTFELMGKLFEMGLRPNR